MEALYAKLYKKYTNLKKEKDTEMEKLNHDQEMKFMNYVAAADEMIEYLRSENDRLGKQVSELRSEISSIRTAKGEECIQYQRLLMEESQKNRELSEEIVRLRHLQQGLCCQGKGDKVDNGRLHTPGSSQGEPSSSNHTSVRMTRKRSREAYERVNKTSYPPEEVEHAQFSNSTHRSCEQTKVGGALQNYCLPPCCRRKISGDDATKTIPTSCMFQELVEFVVGMKLSANTQNDEFSVSVHHLSSGYSFSLTWVNNSAGEPELLYRLLSLGTFERIAPEWMRDVLLFSTKMCPIFFQRVSRIIKT